MWKYPDGSYRQVPPARVEHAGYIRNFAELTRAERDELGYNEAVPLRREPFTTYETEWTKGEDLIYREEVLNQVVDQLAKDEAEGEKVRAERTRMLRACDWTVLPDSPLDSEKLALWSLYREALRDVPQQDGFPHAVAWPEAPAA
ncbi:tail fiber assembly protein [Desulfovibrio caledoniensis]